MKTVLGYLASGICVLVLAAGCSELSSAVPATPTLAPAATDSATAVPTLPIPSLTSSPTVKPIIPSITGMSWDQKEGTLSISIHPWPDVWPWQVFLDGQKIPNEGGNGKPVFRPDAPLDQSPTGLLVGSLPWVSRLDDTDFPCCGTIQFEIPGVGRSNAYEYNFGGLCTTRSTKVCAPAWKVHQGDLVINGSDTFLIEDIKYHQDGNIYVHDTATLTIKNSELEMGRGANPTIHVYIFVDPQATVNIEGSRVYAAPGEGLACLMNSGTVNMLDSPTSIHYLDMSGRAKLSMLNSELVNNIGGILQVSGGSTRVTDSSIGALGLTVPNGSSLEADGLKPGITFSTFDVHDLIPTANYDLVLKNTTLLPDFPPGPFEHGPYERGWIFFFNRDSHARLSNSELRKIFLDISDDTASFHDLQVGVPASFQYRDISVKDVKVSGEWSFSIENSNLTIDNSNYLFLQPSGNSTVTLNNSQMVEFIPRDFSGTMIFNNATWITAGEIIGNVPYHSNSNSFTIKGSLQMASELRTNLQWKNAFVTREYEVIVSDPAGNPQAGVAIRYGGHEVTTDGTGKAKMEINFDETNYNKPAPLQAWQAGKQIASQAIDFFTETPLRLIK